MFRPPIPAQSKLGILDTAKGLISKIEGFEERLEQLKRKVDNVPDGFAILSVLANEPPGIVQQRVTSEYRQNRDNSPLYKSVSELYIYLMESETLLKELIGLVIQKNMLKEAARTRNEIIKSGDVKKKINECFTDAKLESFCDVFNKIYLKCNSILPVYLSTLVSCYWTKENYGSLNDSDKRMFSFIHSFNPQISTDSGSADKFFEEIVKSRKISTKYFSLHYQICDIDTHKLGIDSPLKRPELK